MGGVCVTTFAAGSSVLSFVVWHDSLVLGLYKEIKQWNHEGVCLQTLATGSWVTTLVVWHDVLYSGSDDGTIKQWVDEEWERERKRKNLRNLLLVYSRLTPELDENIAIEIATYF